MSASRVLNFVMKYLIDALMNTLKPINSYFPTEDITLAIVVPSLSTEESKDIVKEAVITTGIPLENIAIIPEAQAVSEVWHSTLEAGKTGHHQQMVAHGEDYMVVNLRDDGMEDIINNYTISLPKRALFTQFIDVEASINEAFEGFLQDTVGKDVFQAYTKAMPDDLRCIQEEAQKRIT